MRISAEVGQNHQGDIKLALKYINTFAALGATAIKFQKRDIDSLFDSQSLERRYDNRNSFGANYGEHRRFLELSKADFELIKSKCSEAEVEFICTPFDLPSVEFLEDIKCDAYKVSSFDLGNLHLLKRLAMTGKDLIFSIGGGKNHHIDDTYEFLLNNKVDPKQISILHCVSLYPCEASMLNLNSINRLKARFPDSIVGISDHYTGVVTGALGYSLGADHRETCNF